MIARNTTDPTTKALSVLEASPFMFYPCGSRYFGDAKDWSDFDFFATVCDPHKALLLANGFKLTAEGEYLDSNTAAVFVQGRVHAILVYSVEDRLQAQEFFKGKSRYDRRCTAKWDEFYKSLAKER